MPHPTRSIYNLKWSLIKALESVDGFEIAVDTDFDELIDKSQGWGEIISLQTIEGDPTDVTFVLAVYSNNSDLLGKRKYSIVSGIDEKFSIMKGIPIYDIESNIIDPFEEDEEELPPEEEKKPITHLVITSKTFTDNVSLEDGLKVCLLTFTGKLYNMVL